MKNWIGRMLNLHSEVYEKVHKSDTDLQECDNVLKSPHMTREVNIGEPVFSFVKCVEENPKRFRLQKLKRKPGMRYDKCEYKFTDKLTNESWEVTIDHRSTAMMYGATIDWLTIDEAAYISRSVALIYRQRLDRLAQLRNIRYKRSTEHERKRLMGVYCK